VFTSFTSNGLSFQMIAMRRELLAVIQRQRVPASCGIPRNARIAALFSVSARLSGMTFARRNSVFLSTKVAIEALSTVSPSQSPTRLFSSTTFGRLSMDLFDNLFY
jgi:hypothetical protein